MANPAVDGYTKTLNHWKTLRKTQKNNNLLTSKRIPKPQYFDKTEADPPGEM